MWTMPTTRLGSLLAWQLRVHPGIALGVHRPAGPTLLQVALWGPCGVFPTINDWQLAMTLAWPWWSLEGFACSHIDSAILLKEVNS
jgi:hypothetical protein